MSKLNFNAIINRNYLDCIEFHTGVIVEQKKSEAKEKKGSCAK